MYISRYELRDSAPVAPPSPPPPRNRCSSCNTLPDCTPARDSGQASSHLRPPYASLCRPAHMSRSCNAMPAKGGVAGLEVLLVQSCRNGQLQVKEHEFSRTHRSVVIQQPRCAPPDAVQDISECVALPSLDHHGFATASDEELHAERLTRYVQLMYATGMQLRPQFCPAQSRDCLPREAQESLSMPASCCCVTKDICRSVTDHGSARGSVGAEGQSFGETLHGGVFPSMGAACRFASSTGIQCC